jgi:hypothetical protein
MNAQCSYSQMAKLHNNNNEKKWNVRTFQNNSMWVQRKVWEISSDKLKIKYYPQKENKIAGHQCLTPVILATQEAENQEDCGLKSNPAK